MKTKSMIIATAIIVNYSLFTVHCFAQGVAVNTTGNAANASAVFDASSTTQGLLIPRMTAAERDLISSPAHSLLIFNTTSNCFEAYNATTLSWVSTGCISACPLPSAPSATAASGVTATSFYANWTAVAGATTYFLDVSTVNTFISYVVQNLNVGNVSTYNVTGLTTGTYYYRVRAYNSCGSSTNSTTMPVTLCSCTALLAWQYKMPITITNTGTSGLVDYQVRITMNTATLIPAKMLITGNDIRVTDNDKCTQLPYWIVPGTINTTTTYIWMKVPNVPVGSKTIYVYYGNTAATLTASFDNTFTKTYSESGLVSLWHLDDGVSPTDDGSGNGHDGTLVNSPAWQGTDGGQWDGQAGVNFSTGNHLYFNGSTNYVDAGNFITSLSSFTFSFWMRINSFTNTNYMPAFSQNDATYTPPSNHFAFYTENNTGSFGFSGKWTDGTSLDTRTNIPFSTGVWKYITITYNGTNVIQYVDGAC